MYKVALDIITISDSMALLCIMGIKLTLGDVFDTFWTIPKHCVKK